MTDARESGVIRETLYSGTGTLRTSGLVRETLRSTGTSGATRILVAGLVRETLRAPPVIAPPASAQARVLVMA